MVQKCDINFIHKTLKDLAKTARFERFRLAKKANAIVQSRKSSNNNRRRHPETLMLRYGTDGELHHHTASKRIRTKANGRENRGALQSKQTSWVGSFRTVRSISSHRGGSELMLSPQTVADYKSTRRIRRQTSIQKQNFYRLLTPDAPGVSPIGSVAKLLMQSVLKSKNKMTKDVVP